MKTATLTELRHDFSRIQAWLDKGEGVDITRRGKLIGRMVPPSHCLPPPKVKKDFMKRLIDVWGDNILSTEQVEATRRAERQLEEAYYQACLGRIVRSEGVNRQTK